jgi:hypothetical protein
VVPVLFTATSIDRIMINGVDATTCNGVQNLPGQPITLNPGTGRQIQFTIIQGGVCGTTTFNPGVSIEVKLHSTGGKEYPKLLVLP